MLSAKSVLVLLSIIGALVLSGCSSAVGPIEPCYSCDYSDDDHSVGIGPAPIYEEPRDSHRPPRFDERDSHHQDDNTEARNREREARERERGGRPSPYNYAVTYSLRLDSAEIMMSFVERVKQGDASVMSELGFESKDLEAIARGENPSAKVLKTISEKLKISLIESHDLIQIIISRYQKAGLIAR